MTKKIIKFGNDPFKDKLANVTPSTKDLQQFISPNPAATNTIYYFKETNGSDFLNQETNYETWENAGISALMIDTDSYPLMTDEAYLKKAAETLSCPIFRWQEVKEQDNLFDSRVIGFDGQVTPISHFDGKTFFNLYKLAEGMHFRLIPIINSKKDWDIIASAMPRYIYLTEAAGESAPPMFKNSRCFFMGPEALKDKFKLKCITKTAP